MRFYLCVGIVAAVASSALANGIVPGTSSLIGTLDYSDTFTLTDFGGIEDRDHSWPLSAADYPADGTPGEGLVVENTYGNPSQSWPDATFKLVADSAGVHPYCPGGSGAGSETGMAEVHAYIGGKYDFGIGYGLRDNFVVQFDAIQTNDRIDILIGDAASVFDASCFSLLVKPGNAPIYIFQPTAGTTTMWDTGLTSGIVTAGEWHNYAAQFDLVNRTVEVFVDEISRGTIDIDAVTNNEVASVPMSASVVGLGFGGGVEYGGATHALNWFDNFQVGGAAVPEPSTMALLFCSFAALAMFRRVRK